MTSITTRKTPHRTIWRVQYRVNGRLVERTFHSKEEAQAWALTTPCRDDEKTRPERSTSSRLKTTSSVLVEEVEFMLSLGRGLDYVADAFSIQRASVERALHRARRHDLIHRDRQLMAREAA